MSNPQISVIICSFNRGPLIPKLLADFRAKSAAVAGAWELLLVDNASTDNTAEAVDGFVNEGAMPVRYLFEPRKGKSFALNRGVREARSDFLVFTDDDVALDEGWFPAAFEASDRRDIVMFGGRVIPVLPARLPRWLLDRNGRPVFGGPLVKHDHGPVEREYDWSMGRPVGANMFVRRSLFDRYGLFRTDLGPVGRSKIGGEDSEISFRFMSANEKVVYYPRAAVYHPIRQDQLRKSVFNRCYFNHGMGWARFIDPPPGTVRYWNVPRYQLRHAAAALSRFALSDIFLPAGERFRRKAELFFLFGMIAGCYKDRHRTASFVPRPERR
jgi:glycosyltransferase involved in cell wall biosynthesis